MFLDHNVNKIANDNDNIAFNLPPGPILGCTQLGENPEEP